MQTTITIKDLTDQIVYRDPQNNITSITGSGAFDIILTSLASFMELQQQEAKITQNQYAELLAQSLPAVLNASIEYVMKAAMTAATVDKVRSEQELTYAERIIKDKEAALMGLDDVAINARKSQDGNAVYKPAYDLPL